MNATYQQPPRPAGRARVRSLGEERALLCPLPSSFSCCSCSSGAAREAARESGDVACVEVEGCMSGEWSEDESSLLVDEEAIKAMFESRPYGVYKYGAVQRGCWTGQVVLARKGDGTFRYSGSTVKTEG